MAVVAGWRSDLNLASRVHAQSRGVSGVRWRARECERNSAAALAKRRNKTRRTSNLVQDDQRERERERDS